MTAVRDPVRYVSFVCRTSATAWSAVCALLDHAEALCPRLSHRVLNPWSDGSMRDEAERVRCALARSLESARGKRGPAPYDSAVADAAVRSLTTSLSEGGLAFVVARVLDACYWADFTHDWLEVEVRGEYAAIIDGLAGRAPLTVAAALVNETKDELLPRNPAAPVVLDGIRDGSAVLPNWVVPGDPAEQTARVRGLLQRARERGVAVVVLPELCATADMVERLAAEWAGRMDAPVLFAGSVHMQDAGRRVNRTSVLLPGVGVAWTHDKYSAFEARDGTMEPIDLQRPRIVLGCGGREADQSFARGYSGGQQSTGVG